MLIRFDNNGIDNSSVSSTDGSKVATAYYLLKSKGVVSSKVRIPAQPDDEAIADTEVALKDSASRIFDLLFDGNDCIYISVYNCVYMDRLSLEILSPYGENSKVCVLTSMGFYKSFDVGGKTGVIEIDLMDGESPSDDSYITSSGFPVINTENGYRPKFINFGSYDNPLKLGIKIVGNDKTSASMIVTCITIPC